MPRNESEAPVRAEGELGLRSGGIPAISPNSHSPPESMDSLLLLCARRIVAQRPLPALPADLYPVLFQAAFLDGKPLVLQDLVATWPFPVLNLQRLVGRRELLPGHTCFKSVKAVIQAVVAQLCRELEKPGSHSSLRVLDMTMLPDSEFCHTPTGMKTWCSTRDLAEACVEVFKHQQEFQRCRSKHDKACSGADMATAALQCPGVDICADLSVIRWSYRMLRDALQIGAAGLLRLKCREFQVENISAPEIVTLLKSLDPSCLRRVDLCCNYFGLTGLSVILPHLSRFPELRSLKLQDNWLDVRHLTPKSGVTMRCVAQQLGMLPSLRELNLAISRLSGNLHQILCDLQAPLESLELPFCYLLPADLAFLSQSIHPPALKRLDLSGHDISQGLLEPLQLLLEKTSASLLYLDLTDCHMTDSHLNALLPTLLRCSRLRFLGLRINPLSLAALKDLLQKTLELPDLHVVVYPVPKDCCKRALPGFVSNFVIDRELLSAATAEISQLLANSWRTDLDWTCAPVGCKAMDYFLL
ncbi:leucine-rich repeat-containing protein 14-like isoform X1 [Oenanthe melanoleuca]|uniref:leucine-rich repeat-containing protein 14-like isoform X1 n=2 Tax=Oenanthe melanoleuca TaxID=2939378 RepID=UPI0024C1A947|nr:leucine-rich repeat-containing protein 14-like isoform X1 [Oenanthe melanoleuca]